MTIKTALRDLNNALLDLQQSDYNTYVRPLKRLADALNDEELQPLNHELRAKADWDRFIENSDKGGGMVGSASLNWPDDREEEMGLVLLLIERAAADPSWFMNFSHEYYYAGRKLIAGIQKLTTAVLIPFSRDYKIYVESQTPTVSSATNSTELNRVFIVHGHDDSAREMVARFIKTVGLEPVILNEQANCGMTIPEKLIANANVGFAVVLLTPDDVGREKPGQCDNPRARQNVILELGYFVGRLGRERVCALSKGNVEIPSDYLGVVLTPLDINGGWRQKLGQELQTAGYEVDWNTVMSAN